MRKKLGLLFWLIALSQVTPAYAYIGPGAGAGTIAIVLGILASIFLAFVGIIWYPIKRLLRKRKTSTRTSSESSGEAKASGSDSGSGD